MPDDRDTLKLEYRGSTVTATRRTVLSVCWSSVLLMMNGCSLLEISEQAKAVDGVSIVRGKIDSSIKGYPIYVAIYKQVGEIFERRDHSLVGETGRFEYRVVPNRFTLGAFVDLNRDGEYQRNEPATYLGIENRAPTVLDVLPNQVVDVPVLGIEGPIEIPDDFQIVNNDMSEARNLGRVVSFDDPVFDESARSLGLWKPMDYIARFGGGLMFLEPYDPAKIPVLFVHGIGGSAIEFKTIIDAMDRRRFQPWVMQYASGLRLATLSGYMDEALARLQVQHRFTDMIVVAHSMGGMVTRSFVMQHRERRRPYRLRMVMTINSPIHGMDSAAVGVRYSPVVVSSWRDVAPDSAFVATYVDWKWPKDIPYHLIFSYLPSEEGDGVVPLSSQLSLSLQDEATRVLGFESEHSAILTNAEFVRRFGQIISAYE